MAFRRLYITTEEYFALPHAGNSDIKNAHKILTGGEMPDYTPNKPYYFGSAYDAVLTDPSTLDSMDLSKDERNDVIHMIRSLQRDNVYDSLFSPAIGGETQVVFVDDEFPIEYDGAKFTIPVKCKYDLFNPNPVFNFGSDIKSTDAYTDHGFRTAADWFEYDQQAAWYMDIPGTNMFPFFGVSKRNYKVFRITVKRGDPMYISGRNKYLRRAVSWWKLNGSSL